MGSQSQYPTGAFIAYGNASTPLRSHVAEISYRNIPIKLRQSLQIERHRSAFPAGEYLQLRPYKLRSKFSMNGEYLLQTPGGFFLFLEERRKCFSVLLGRRIGLTDGAVPQIFNQRLAMLVELIG